MMSAKRQRVSGVNTRQVPMDVLVQASEIAAASVAAAASVSIAMPFDSGLQNETDNQRANKIAFKLTTLLGGETPVLSFSCMDFGSYFTICATGFKALSVSRLQTVLYDDLGLDGKFVSDIEFCFSSCTLRVHVISVTKRRPKTVSLADRPSYLTKRKQCEETRAATEDEAKFVVIDEKTVPSIVDRQILGNVLMFTKMLCGGSTPVTVKSEIDGKFDGGYIVGVRGYSLLRVSDLVMPMHAFPYHIDDVVVTFDACAMQFRVRCYINPSRTPWTAYGVRYVLF